MPIYVVEAKGPVAEYWNKRGVSHLLYGDRPRAYRDLDDAVERANQLKRLRRNPQDIDYEVKDVPLDYAYKYWPVG